jgi:hypothetical protein
MWVTLQLLELNVLRPLNATDRAARLPKEMNLTRQAGKVAVGNSQIDSRRLCLRRGPAASRSEALMIYST